MSDPFAGAEPTLAPYASWGRRFAAILVDGFLLALPFAFAILLAVTLAEDDNDPVWLAVWIGWLVWIVLPFVYYTAFHGGPRGQTLGKRLLGIRVVGEDFRPIGYARAFGRYLIGVVLWLLCYVPGLIDSLWPLWNDKNQALHDKAVNSIVVRAT